MNKTKILFSFGGILLLLNILLLFKISNTRKDYSDLIENLVKIEQQISLKDVLLEVYDTDFQSHLYSESLSIAKDKKNKAILDKIFDEKQKLVLRYSELNCNTCIDVQFDALKKLAKKIGEKNIIILASYKSDADFNRFMRINKLNFEVYNVEHINLPLEKRNIPYYFITDKSLFAKLVFIPRKEYPKVYEKYFEIITKRFFTK
jgi:hypothetical protein